MKILVFGKTGQVGLGLRRDLKFLGDVRRVGRDQADLTDLTSVENAIKESKPEVIVNAAAYTNVDKAETEAATAELVNARAPGVMAQMAKSIDALMVHYSTDYVFDGKGAAPYTEAAPTNPINVYGRTKLEGERAIRAATDKHLILRTSWVYSNDGRNFLNTILRLARERDELTIVADQQGTPTYARALSAATATLIKKSGHLGAESYGTYNVTCAGMTSWHGFAGEILRLSGNTGVRLVPITTAEFPTPAKRPAYSHLDNAKLERTFGVRLPTWQDALRECLSSRVAAQ